ncbi:unnamed protein product [Trichobilharzia szidati]|nr:unnamed protein product [Trichobilharzia szidati]
MTLDSSREVIVKPSNVFFHRSDKGNFNTCEVLIVNKSARTLRFKVLSTARSRYTLSTCKGLLKSGEFVKTDISVSRIPVNDDVAKDFFKVQFFDSIDGSAFCEHYICSTISRNPSQNVISRDSDSCSTWPSRYHDVGLSVASLRAASLSRAIGDLVGSEKHSVNSKAYLSVDRAKSLVFPNFSSTMKVQKTITNPNTLKIGHVNNASETGNSKTGVLLLYDLFYSFLFLLSVVVCLFGILLPFLPYDIKLWLLSKILRESPKSDYPASMPNSLAFPYDAKFYKQTSSSDTTYSSATECPAGDNLSKDEFNRQTRLAFVAFKAAFHSICKALIALDPSVAIANMSWFCLGLLIMYRWTKRR